MNSEGIELFCLISILKFGPAIGIVSSIIIGLPKSVFIIIGSVISSTILKLVLVVIAKGRGLSVLNSISCLAESLLYNTLIAGIIISFPKFKANSLK